MEAASQKKKKNNNNRAPHTTESLKRTFLWQASAFSRPGFAVTGVDFPLRTVRVASRQLPRLGEGLAGGVARRGLAQAALGFGFESGLVQGFLLRGPVAVHLRLVQQVVVDAVGLVSLGQVLIEREHPCGQHSQTNPLIEALGFRDECKTLP